MSLKTIANKFFAPARKVRDFFSSFGVGDKPTTDFFNAIARGKKEKVETLLQSGRVSADMYESLPLRWAADKGHADIVEILLAGGADPVKIGGRDLQQRLEESAKGWLGRERGEFKKSAAILDEALRRRGL